MPSGPFDDIPRHVQGLHQQAGWPGTVYNYTPVDTTSGGNWYDDTGGGDEGWESDGGEAVTIRIETDVAPEVVRGAGGRVIEGDVIVVVDPSDHSAGKAGFTDGKGEDARATEIVDEDSGERYRVLRVIDQHTGILRLDSEEIR